MSRAFKLIATVLRIFVLVGPGIVVHSMFAANFTVKMVNFQFSPKNLTVAVGDTVTWVNQDFTQHDTVSGTNRIPTGIWGSPLLNNGGSFSFTFNVPPGGYGYYCTPHVFTFNMVGSITVVAPNQPPSVSITNPVEGAVFNPGTDITVSATASDDGSVARVDFFANGSPVGSASSAPYTVTISSPPVGTYALTAVAVDNLGASTTSSPIHVSVQAGNLPPTVAITNLVDGQTVFAGTNLLLAASATDADGSVSQVQFFTNGVPVGTVTAPPYQVFLNNLAVGSYAITAIATDNLGATGSSPVINLNVVTPTFLPVFVTPPTNQSAIAGSTVIFFAEASGTPPISYQWLFKGTPIAGATLQTLTLSNIQSNNAGSYSVIASNFFGFATSSNGVLTVSPPPNIPPTVTLISPANGSLFAVGQAIPFSATASDSNGTIASVEFFRSNLFASSLGVVTNPPFDLIVTNLEPGRFAIFASATDNQGASSDSTPVEIQVANPPVLLTSPPGPGIALGTSIELSIQPDTNLPSPTSIQFFVNGQPLAGSIWQPGEAGDNLLTAIANFTGGSLTSAPVSIRIFCTDSNRPSVAITEGPPNFANLTNALLSLSGTAADDCRVDYVEVQLNNVIAAHLINADSWHFATNLAPGLTVIRVRSVDFATNVSFDVTRFVTYQVNTGLAVSADAGGTVTPNLNRVKLRQGNYYTVTAKPNPNFVFTGWEGAGLLQTNFPRLTFRLSENLTNLVAHFQPSPFPARAGIYSGLFLNTNSPTDPIDSSGAFDLSLNRSGLFTGRLRMNGLSYPFRAAFDISGASLVPVLRPGLTPVVLALQLNLADPSNHIAGFATNQTGKAKSFAPISAVFTSSTNSQPAAGGHRFNLVDQSNDSSAVIVQALAGVSASSLATVLGVAENIKFTISSRVSAGGDCPFYLSIDHGAQAFAGWLHFGPYGAADGQIYWMHSGTNSTSTLDVLPPTQ